MIAFTCPNCRKSFSIAEENAGQQFRCPGCEQLATVSRLDAASCPDDLATVPPAAVSSTPETVSACVMPVPGDVTAAVPPSPSAPATHTSAGSDHVPGYEVLGELGRGGMGVVYKAWQVGLNRPCALKMILAGDHAGEDDLARFRTEAEAIARLQHPNIVAVFEVGQHGGKPFFSLEFCAGGSLDRKLAGTPIDPREAARLVQTLAQAMQAAHQANVIHRDLKPANVLLTADGTPKITDFGLAKKLDQSSQTQTGVTMGPPSYMAPEQAEGKKTVGPPADIYALGAILYEMLTGRPPFKAATSFDTLMQVVSEEPVPPRQLNAKVPDDLETIVLKCLLKDPGKRYCSAQELADDLGRFLAGEPILARPVGRLERAGKWVRRNPIVAALTAAVAVALLLGAGVATGFGLSARANAVLANEKTEDAQREADRADDEAHRANTAAAKARQEAARADREAKEAKRLAKQEKKAREEAGKEKTRAEREAKEAKRLAAEEKKARKEAEDNEKAAKAQAYRADVTLHRFHIKPALAAWEQNDVGAVEAIPAEVPPPFQQTWEIRHLRQLCRRKAMSLKGHRFGVSSVAYSPDGKRIVSGGGHEMKVWDAATGQDLLTLQGHTRFVVSSVAYSPDGKRIVSASGIYDRRWGRYVAGELKVWDAATGQELLTLKGHTDRVTSAAYSPDGKRVFGRAVDGKVLAVTPPDPRLVPLDHQTAHELTALRTEVERALATQKP
jgi:hypothetical protein